MRWAITHRPQDLPRNKHTLAEGETLEEEDMPLSTNDFIGATQNLRVVKEMVDVCLACSINGFIRTWFVDKRNSAMLVRMTEC